MRQHIFENERDGLNTTVEQKYEDGPAHQLVEKLFTFQQMDREQAERARAITEASYNFGVLLADLCPPSRELTIAIGHISDARMLANASIALNE